MIQTINPATEQLIKTYAYMSHAEVEKILQAVDTRYQQWKKTSLTDRSQLLHNLADILLKYQYDLAHLITEEMGGKRMREFANLKTLTLHYAAD